MNIVLNKTDEIVMRLLHYFIIEQNYNPVVLHGAKDEIWLEKSDGDYKIIRIVSNYIHNNEQLDFDIYRTKQIIKKIKKKMFLFKVPSLSIFVNLGDNVELDKANSDYIDLANLNSFFMPFLSLELSSPSLTIFKLLAKYIVMLLSLK